jgi:hypothetical protein
VIVDGIDIPIVAMQNHQIDIAIPAGKFKIGLHTIEVVQDVMLTIVDRQPPEKRGGFRSNAAGFTLLPKLVDVQPPSAGPDDTITVKLSPVVYPQQQLLLLLGDNSIPPATPLKFDSPPTDTIDFKLPATEHVIPPGTYLLRVRVDGAETRLTVDPTTKRYSGPTYRVT